MPETIGFIGAGKVGTALAALLSRKGYNIVSIYDIKKEAANNLAHQIKGCRIADNPNQTAKTSQIVFITTPDSVIPHIAQSVIWQQGQAVVHCSGADSTSILEPAQKAGAKTAAFHPLQTFAGAKEAMENIPGSTFAIEAEEPLLTALKKMTEDLGGSWIILKAEDKPAYHAAAVFASNYLVTLVKMATDLWKTFNVSPEQAIKALMPLIQGTLHNIETIGVPDCLTGPIARGDTGTIEKHLLTIREKAPHLLNAYKSLGLQTIPIASAKGTITENKVKELEPYFKI